MAVNSIMKNRTQFQREILDSEHGEKMLSGEADGTVMVIDDFAKLEANPKKKPRSYKMSFFPTNYRIVCYEAKNGLFAQDQYAQLTYKDLDSISYITCVGEKGNVFCSTEFVAKQGSEYPSIIFKIDIDDLMTFDSYRAILTSISQKSRTKIDDVTDYDMLRQSKMFESAYMPDKKVVEETKIEDTFLYKGELEDQARAHAKLEQEQRVIENKIAARKRRKEGYNANNDINEMYDSYERQVAEQNAATVQQQRTWREVQIANQRAAAQRAAQYSSPVQQQQQRQQRQQRPSGGRRINEQAQAAKNDRLNAWTNNNNRR